MKSNYESMEFSPADYNNQPHEADSERYTKKRKRKSFWAVPWDGSMRHPNASDDLSIGLANYLTYSIENLSASYEKDYDLAVDKGWIRDGTSVADVDHLSKDKTLKEGDYDHLRLLYKYYALKDLIARSLYDSQLMRLQRNSMNNIGVTESSSPELKLAAEGLAAPEEVLSIIENHPTLVSVELAKESHALRYDGADEVNEYMYGVLKESSMLVGDDKLEKYKKILSDPEVPATIIERKRIVGLKEVDDELLVVAQRYRLMVRGDKDAAEFDKYLGRKVKNDQRQHELFAMVRESLPFAKDDDPDFRWLQPISTSYYAYYPSRVTPDSL